MYQLYRYMYIYNYSDCTLYLIGQLKYLPISNKLPSFSRSLDLWLNKPNISLNLGTTTNICTFSYSVNLEPYYAVFFTQI